MHRKLVLIVASDPAAAKGWSEFSSRRTRPDRGNDEIAEACRSSVPAV
jgi:hypothetical protein